MAFGLGDFLEHRFQAIFEFAAIFCSGHKRGEIQRHDTFRTQHFWNVARDNALREAFDDSGLADAGLADEHRIIFCAPRQNLHHAADFIVPANHRIEFPAPGQLDQIAAVLFESAERGFRILRSDAMAAAHRGERLQNGFAGRPMLGEQFRGWIFTYRGDGQQNVLGGNIFILELLGLDKRAFQNFI